MFAKVAFPISNYQTFTYLIPNALAKKLSIGSRIIAPFRSQNIQGIVVNIEKSTDYAGKTKSIVSLVDDVNVFTPELWKLLLWISEYYMTPIGMVAKAAFPNSLSTRYSPPKRWFVKLLSKKNIKMIEGLRVNAPKQYSILKVLSSSNFSIKVSLLNEYASNPLKICQSLEGKGLVRLFEKENLPDLNGMSFEPMNKKIDFNDDQKIALKKINRLLDKKKYSPFLLHGVTGSGKTEIFIKAVEKCLSTNRTAIILLPEITLTPQISGRFKSIFGDAVAIWHSKLSKSQRAWTWREICKGNFKIVIGARSAIFAPMRHLGLIVVDEEQEGSFQQDSPSPRYHARDVAMMRANINKSMIILSSATPSLESYYNFKKNKIKILNLPKRYGGASYPKVHLVDMINEKTETGKTGQVISDLLQSKIESRLLQNQQIILLQNRRGFSPIIRCNSCASVLMCPNCSVTINFHIKMNSFVCHFCGFTIKKDSNTSCLECRSKDLYFGGAGTQKIEALLEDTFPNAVVRRLDMDTSNSGVNIAKLLTSFKKNEINILLGTQMIAKGLDFPNATLVGIINADLGLYLPDFRAGEKIFQLIYQASGRSGRSKIPGEVVIQTYSPNNSVIQCAANLDLHSYYDIALKEREELDYPPFSWLVKVEFVGMQKKAVSNLALEISNSIKGKYFGLSTLGPSPCYLEKLRGNFRYQLIFKSKKTIDPNGKKLHEFIKKNFKFVNKKSILGNNKIIIQFNPLSLI